MSARSENGTQPLSCAPVSERFQSPLHVTECTLGMDDVFLTGSGVWKLETLTIGTEYRRSGGSSPVNLDFEVTVNTPDRPGAGLYKAASLRYPAAAHTSECGAVTPGGWAKLGACIGSWLPFGSDGIDSPPCPCPGKIHTTVRHDNVNV